MSSGFTEDEMRRALCLDTATHSSPSTPQPTQPVTKAKSEPRVVGKPKLLSPKLRVTLLVSKEFEGETVELTHDADTMSHSDAEQQAKGIAKKAKYRFFDLVSIKPFE